MLKTMQALAAILNRPLLKSFLAYHIGALGKLNIIASFTV